MTIKLIATKKDPFVFPHDNATKGKKQKNVLSHLACIFGGFCVPEEENENEDANEEEEFHALSSSLLQIDCNDSCNRSLETDLLLPSQECIDEQLQSASTTRNVEKKSSQLVSTISVCSFLVPVQLKYCLFEYLRKIVEPNASTIVALQLLFLPAFVMLMYQRNKANLDENINPDNDTPLIISTANSSTVNTVNYHRSDTIESSASSSLYAETSVSLQHRQSLLANQLNINLEEATQNLPDVTDWKYGPNFVQPCGDTQCSVPPNQSLPIGIPFDFESSLFKGKILIRLKNGKSQDTQSSQAFFEVHNWVQRQVVIQGQFKKTLKMSQLWFGGIFDKKLKLVPPPRIGKFMNNLFEKLSPGIVLDLSCDKPKVLSLLGSGSHTMSIDEPGKEPDIMSANLPERTFMSNDLKSSQQRKSALGNPKVASSYECDIGMVYTFNTCDPVLDMADYRLRLPILTVDFTKVLGHDQPISIRAVTAPDDESGESLFHFRFWHERTLEKMK